MKEILRQLSIVTTSLFLGIILAEGTLRFFNSNGKNYDVEMWKYSKQLKFPSEDVNIGHEHKPNAKAMLQNVEIRTNKYGMRGADPLKNQDRTILFLGSSITMGWGVLEKDIFTTLLKNKFEHEQISVDILNAGVGNYNTTRYVHNYFKNLYVLKPTDIVVHYFLNDAELLVQSNGNFFTRNFQLGVLTWKLYQQVFGALSDKTLIQHYNTIYNPQSSGFTKMKKALIELSNYCKSNQINLVISMVPDIHKLKIIHLSIFTIQCISWQTIRKWFSLIF